MSDLIEREYLLNIARQEEAYGYVSEHEILNAPTAEPNEYVKDGTLTVQMPTIKEAKAVDKIVVYADTYKQEYFMPIAEPLVTVKAKQNEGLYLNTDEETLLETEYIVVATDGRYKEYIHETDGKPKMEKWKIEIEGNGWNEWYVFNCPSCGARIKDNMGYHEWEFNYCPNCGAKMERSE